MSNNILYPVFDFDINLESKTKNKPKKPLTRLQFEKIKEEVLDSCIKAYISRMRYGGLTNFRENNELRNDAYIAFCNFAKNKFDKSKCGKIGKVNYKGKDQPKKLSWYFYNFFCHSVNGISCDYKKAKKRRLGVFPDNVAINAEEIEDSAFFSLLKVKDLKEALDRELKNLTPEEQEVFRLRIVDGYRFSELLEVTPNFRVLNNKVQLFLNDFIIKYSDLAAETFNTKADKYSDRVAKKSRKRSSSRKSVDNLKNRDSDVNDKKETRSE